MDIIEIITLAAWYCGLFIVFFPLCIWISKYVPMKLLIAVNIIMCIILCAAINIIATISDFFIRDFFISLTVLLTLYYIPCLALYFYYRRGEKKKYGFKVHLLKTSVMAACFFPVFYTLVASFMVMY